MFSPLRNNGLGRLTTWQRSKRCRATVVLFRCRLVRFDPMAIARIYPLQKISDYEGCEMERDWLDVPFDDKDYAKECGAKWDWAEERWYAPKAEMAALDRWRAKPPIPNVLVGEDRNFGSGLFVDLVPQSAWFTNVRSCVNAVDWDRIRRMVTSRAGKKCEICGAERDKKAKIRLEAHERWEYDDARHVQILRRLICLCEPCHTATHMGLARIRGVENEAIEHLARVNNWSEAQTADHIPRAFAAWEMRSQVEWSLDISMLDNIGIAITRPPEASQRKTCADSRTRDLSGEEESGEELDDEAGLATQYGSKDDGAIVAALAAIESRYRGMNSTWIEALDMCRANRGKAGFPKWPTWCLLPMGAAGRVVRSLLQVERTRYVAVSGNGKRDSTLDAANEIAALYAWWQGKGIYYFDDDLAEALLETENTDALPVEALMHPPEWGVCVVVPQKLQPLLGCSAFIAHLQWHIEEGKRELRVVRLFKNEDGYTLARLQPLQLDSGTVSGGIEDSLRFYLQRNRQLSQSGNSAQRVTAADMERTIESHRRIYRPILALLAYLGSVEADIVDASERKIRVPASGREGREIDAKPMKNYEVGFRIGAQLRKGGGTRYDSSLPSGGTGRTVVPHLRKAHWHHYWIGPKSDPTQRELVVRWVNPVLVGGKDAIPTVHPVRERL